jgi:glucosamine 6-phosphate synthetase-like amidotransferase/phosphosugar isomerase protein
MCGLIGFNGAGNFNTDKIKLLMLYNESRGKHSTGYYTHNIDAHQLSRIAKRVGEVNEVLLPKFNPTPSKIFIGHTRHATMGDLKDVNNAHPFMIGNTVGAHNGVIKNWEAIVTKYDIDKSLITVDSQVIFHSIDKNKNMEVFQHIDGAFAVIFTNTDITNNKCYVMRNKERPLFRGVIIDEEGNTGMYMSSLKNSLEAINCSNIKEFKEDYMYEITEGKITNCTKIAKFVQPPPPVVIIKPEGRTIKETHSFLEGPVMFKKIVYVDGSIDLVKQGYTIYLQNKQRETVEVRDGKKYLRCWYDEISYTEVNIGIIYTESKSKEESDFGNQELLMSEEVVGELYNLYGNLVCSHMHLEENIRLNDVVTEDDIAGLVESIDILTELLYGEKQESNGI